jgi:coenzyme F420-0:L-glutamate ligase / coenzyme F420-1:gamma-L-glutamate ligase
LGARRAHPDSRRLAITRELRIRPLLGLPELREGDELGRLVADAAHPAADDVVVISQKAVSKVEGRVRRLAEVEPGRRAVALGEDLGKDPAVIELVFGESVRVVRAERGVLITETREGWVCANAGIDSSNLAEGEVSLLPLDGDASARRIRAEIAAASGASPAVVIADSFGRAWRIGQADIAIGCAGIAALADWRGRRDAQGGELSATVIAVADELASAADLVRDKDSGVPGAVISGAGDLVIPDDGPGAGPLIRPADEDLFR